MQHFLCVVAQGSDVSLDGTNRKLKESEVCTDMNRRCCQSRSGPGKHQLVTVQLHIRASQHLCSTLCTVIDEIGRDELDRTVINENERLRQTDEPEWLCCGAHVFLRTTLAGFTPVFVWLAACLLVSWCQWLVSGCQLEVHVLGSCGRFAGQSGQQLFL